MLVCVLVGHSTSRADRRRCHPQSTDPQCIPPMEFNDFLNYPKKHRRSAPDLASSGFIQKQRNLNNYPSFHPPLKSTPSYLQTTTVAFVKQTPTAKKSFWQPPLPPPISMPDLKQKNRPLLLSTDNTVFNNLEQKGQRDTLKDSSTNLKTLQNTVSLKVNENRKTARKPVSNKINQSVPPFKPISKNEFVKFENAGTLKTNNKLTNEGEKRTLKEHITSTIRQQSVKVDAESTAVFPNPSLSSTFVVIRHPQRIRTTTVENAKAFTLHTSTVLSVNTKHLKEKNITNDDNITTAYNFVRDTRFENFFKNGNINGFTSTSSGNTSKVE